MQEFSTLVFKISIYMLQEIIKSFVPFIKNDTEFDSKVQYNKIYKIRI